MTTQDIITAINTVGFPIVACGYMAWRDWKQNNMHKEEMDKISGVVNKLEIAITNLAEKLK